MLAVKFHTLIIIVFILFNINTNRNVECNEAPRAKRKKQSQNDENKFIPEVSLTIENEEILVKSSNIKEDHIDSTIDILKTCPICKVKRNLLQYALYSYWNNDLDISYACACHYLLNKPEDGIAQSIMYSIEQSKHTLINNSKTKSLPPSNIPSSIKKWEVLGPINVGKLEVDADPTFMNTNYDIDPCLYILGLPNNVSIYSDLISNGEIKWKDYSVNNKNEIETQFQVSWNELLQGLGSIAGYEFQGWARTTTYVKTSGSYLISCDGSHTVYIRNNHITHVLVGDVYRSGKIKSSVDLRIGLVGIILPLRGVGQTSFRCSLELASINSIIVYEPTNIPDLLDMNLPQYKGKGYLLTSLFSIAIQNIQSNSIVIDISVDKPLGQDNEFYIQEAKSYIEHNMYEYVKENEFTINTNITVRNSYNKGEIIIAPGQTMSLSLEIIPLLIGNKTKPTFLSCRKNKVFYILITPSRGSQVKVELPFNCRKRDQSFLISYLDIDDSVSQAAVIFPLEYSKPEYTQELEMNYAGNIMKENRNINNFCIDTTSISNDGDSKLCLHSSQLKNISDSSNWDDIHTYPVLLTMHGSGIDAINHADSHKYMPPGKKDYIFGVKGHILLAPSRFGAHNWEGIGELSARQALISLQYVLQNSLLDKLPKVRLESGISSGHSMGGHGAWMTSLNAPNYFNCLAPLSGWINKEEYGSANAFFYLDISNSYIHSDMKILLENAMSEYHTDKVITNIQDLEVFLRVGSEDNTVSPWFSRRIYRLLQHYHINATYEEVTNKQHWWWDTISTNDGGVMNDLTMRNFYTKCEKNSKNLLIFKKLYINALNSSINLDNDYKLSKYMKAKFLYRDNVVINTTFINLSDMKWRRCDSNHIIVKVINPATNLGMCGIQIIQQYKMMSLSSIDIQCIKIYNDTTLYSNNTTDNDIFYIKECLIKSKNVRKLKLKFGFDSILYGVRNLIIDNIYFDLSKLSVVANSESVLIYNESIQIYNNNLLLDNIINNQYITNKKYFEICWLDHLNKQIQAFPCISNNNNDADNNNNTDSNNNSDSNDHNNNVDSYITEKSLTNYGPIRLLYNKPFYIVYGTPPNQLLRKSMQDLAVYIGNLHFASHRTNVKILSDLEYRGGGYSKRNPSTNLMFIGGPSMNKIMNIICKQYPFDNDQVLLNNNQSTNILGLNCKIPEAIHFNGGYEFPNNNKNQYTFSFDNMIFNENNTESIIFTLPFYNDILHKSTYHSMINHHRIGMAVCIHANTYEGYLHMSRLAWPVIPPMVRGPFANYVPDFMIINKNIWSEGFGGVVKAGYWSYNWKINKLQYYTI